MTWRGCVLERLTYRRQFLMGKNASIKGWEVVEIKNDLRAAVHPDLEYEQIIVGNCHITLLGYLINPYHPNNNNLDNLKMLAVGVETFEDLIKNTYEYSGRWVLIYNNQQEVKLMNDPCGMRQVYYKFDETGIWCGSQPTIIANTIGVDRNTDEDVLEYLSSDYYENEERPWYGDGTAYKGVKHLIPNHYLNLGTGKVTRFWIENEEINNFEQSVEEAKEILTGSLTAINNRFDPMLAVTAGWDSRLLLAATKHIKEDIYYFISTMNIFNNEHMDIKTPKNLLEKLELKLHVIDDLPELREEFMGVLEKNVFNARRLPKTLTIQYHNDFLSDKISVNGNGSEIARSFYGHKHPNDIDVDYLLKIIACPKYPYIEYELEKWLGEAKKVSKEKGIHLMDLFYWEQRMGNWGSMYQSEQDIAIDEFSPYNNRKLLMTLLKVDVQYRISPEHLLYKRLIEDLWSDTLSEPINPESLKMKVKSFLVGLMPLTMKNAVKRHYVAFRNKKSGSQ